MPTGPCAAHDVQASPKVLGPAYAGSRVTFRIRLHTTTSPACYWKVSPQTLVVKLTSGPDRIWSTQDCKKAVPTQRVVVRNNHYTPVDVSWRGQRSDGTCSRTTAWAEPGYYHVEAAALGAEPADVQFALEKPQPVTITPSPTPTATPGPTPGPTPTGAPRPARPRSRSRSTDPGRDGWSQNRPRGGAEARS